jgi:hypothetical protein
MPWKKSRKVNLGSEMETADVLLLKNILMKVYCESWTNQSYKFCKQGDGRDVLICS